MATCTVPSRIEKCSNKCCELTEGTLIIILETGTNFMEDGSNDLTEFLS
jgi:hypothetical protein